MNKKDTLLSHEIAIYLTLLTDKLDRVKATSDSAVEIKDLSHKLLKLLEPVVDDFYSLNGISKTTYFQEIEKKIETIVRKNFENILN